MTPIKVIKSWHCETCSPACCQPIHSHIIAHLVPFRAIIHSFTCLPLIFLSWAPLSFMLQPSHTAASAEAFKETWSIKSAKRSTQEALKRPSVQLMVTETATERREWRLGPAVGKGELSRGIGDEPGPNKGRDNCFVLLGAFLWCEGSRNDTPHMVFGWSGHWEARKDSSLMQEWGKCNGGGCCVENIVIHSNEKMVQKAASTRENKSGIC